MNKYYVHVLGPDDMIEVPSWLSALELANTLNGGFADNREGATENDPVMYALAMKKDVE